MTRFPSRDARAADEFSAASISSMCVFLPSMPAVVVYGWIGAAHQLGASLAALTAGTIRTYLGDYRDAFWLSGGLCLVAATLLLWTRNAPRHSTQLASAVAETA